MKEIVKVFIKIVGVAQIFFLNIQSFDTETK